MSTRLSFTLSILSSCIVFFLSSCGSAPTENTLEVSDVQVMGDHSEYLQVVDGSYTMKAVKGNIVLPIKLKLVKEIDLEKPKMGSISLVPLDEAGVALPDLGLSFSPASMDEWASVAQLLKGKVGDEQLVSFKWSYFSDEERQARILTDAHSFKITKATISRNSSSAPAVASSAPERIREEEVPTGTPQVDAAKWDKFLDDYEDYVDEYLKFYKKAMQGDQTALAAYPAILEKATKLQKNMAEGQANNQLTPSQIGRMMKIQAKLTSAAASAY